MGQEISATEFQQQDFDEFRRRVADETDTLADWIADGHLADDLPVGGFELEAWLVSADGLPCPRNREFLELTPAGVACPELASFNVELNTEPRPLTADALRRMAADLQARWDSCRQAAASLSVKLAAVGILPSVRALDLSVANMSDLNRYRALNAEIMRLRAGRPMELAISGRQRLDLSHHDVMLEAATTSFQIHLQVTVRTAPLVMNLAQQVSAPMVAASANSPYFLGLDLWDETRIPVFEQAVDARDLRSGHDPGPARVGFDGGWVCNSVLECFRDNLLRYPPLLPIELEDDGLLPHLRLHNGTIWRWNRPLLGSDAHGKPHFRVEHRVVAAGPTIPDMIANAALFYGVVLAYSLDGRIMDLAPADARDNFYAAARHGLDANLVWQGGRRGRARDLLLEELIPAARRGLERAGFDSDDVIEYLRLIKERVSTGRNGSWWQRASVARHGTDMATLTLAYMDHQESGLPVHRWRP